MFHTWYELLDPYLNTTNILVCPSRKGKRIKTTHVGGTPFPYPVATDYAMNHVLGGELSHWVNYVHTKDSSVKNHSKVVYLVDSGVQANASKNPSVDVNSTTKLGAFMIGDPAVMINGSGCPAVHDRPEQPVVGWPTPAPRRAQCQLALRRARRGDETVLVSRQDALAEPGHRRPVSPSTESIHTLILAMM